MCIYVRSRYRCGCLKFEFEELYWTLRTECFDSMNTGKCSAPEYLDDDNEDLHLAECCGDEECPGWPTGSRKNALDKAEATEKALIREHEAQLAREEKGKEKLNKKHKQKWNSHS